MEKDTIITLDDETEYALLDELSIEGKKYFFAIKVDKTSGNPTDIFDIFEEETENDETYVVTLEDGDLKQSVLQQFTKNYSNTTN